jgi:hypothetical protein
MRDMDKTGSLKQKGHFCVLISIPDNRYGNSIAFVELAASEFASNEE